MFDCVLLAAGASSRMGPRGHKLLLPLAGSTVVEASAQAAIEAGCRLIIVVGCRAAEVSALFGAEAYRESRRLGRLLLAENSRWELGMVSSIQAALPAVRGEAFFVAQGDMPFVRPAGYALLARASAEARAGVVVAAFAAAHRGRAGHPVLLPSAWIPAILELEDGERLRPFVEERGLGLVEAGPGVVEDIDSPEDYEAALARA